MFGAFRIPKPPVALFFWSRREIPSLSPFLSRALCVLRDNLPRRSPYQFLSPFRFRFYISDGKSLSATSLEWSRTKKPTASGIVWSSKKWPLWSITAYGLVAVFCPMKSSDLPHWSKDWQRLWTSKKVSAKSKRYDTFSGQTNFRLCTSVGTCSP